MGGGYYDRDMVATGDSPSESDVGKQSNLNPGLDPKTYTEEESRIHNDNLHPIVFALDVTGSMGDWPKIIYDKMPMFYGQIKMQNYCKDPAISFCAVGDTGDQAPLQVTPFGQGKEIDEMIKKLFLEGGGSGVISAHESYELSAYFYNRFVTISNFEIPFFFLTGDEHYYENPDQQVYEKILATPVQKVINGTLEWQRLAKHYNFFHVRKEYGGSDEQPILKQWANAIGEQRILQCNTPKACIDVILGAIAITTGARTLETYVKDMQERGQTEERIVEVSAALKKYAKAFAEGSIKPIVGNPTHAPHAPVEKGEVPKPAAEAPPV